MVFPASIEGVVEHDDLVGLLRDYVRPHVELGLLRDVVEVVEEKQSEDQKTRERIQKEKKRMKRAIRKELSDELSRTDKETRTIKSALYQLVDVALGDKIMIPYEEEIAYHSQETASVMASSWVEYLAMALEKETEKHLNEYLLPKDTAAIDPEVSEAYTLNIAQLLIRTEDAADVMKRLAQTLFENRSYVDLDLGIRIEKQQKEYVARTVCKAQ